MYKYKLFLFFGLISLFSCKHDLDVDISQVELKELSALSLNKDFFALNINNFEKKNNISQKLIIPSISEPKVLKDILKNVD